MVLDKEFGGLNVSPMQVDKSTSSLQIYTVHKFGVVICSLLF